MDARTILCFGDSNTHGSRPMPALDCLRERLPPDARWPGVMAAALGPRWRMIEEGHPGRTTVHDDPVEGPHKNGARALPVLLESHRPIDLVVMMLGTNDLKARFALEPEEIAAGLESLARTIMTADCGPGGGAPRLVLVAPVPIEEAGCLAEMFRGGAAKGRRLSPLIAALADRLGVPFVDAGALAQVDPLDGVHLDAAAHRAIGAAVAAAVEEAFRERETGPC